MIVLKIYELEQFYNRWNEKLNSYLSHDLKDVFDKFFSVFVIYNRIYNVVEVVLSKSKELDNLKKLGLIHKKKKVTDNQAATICVAHYLKDQSVQILLDLHSEIEVFKKILETEKFYIDLDYGKPQRTEDLKLLKGLKSPNTFEQLKAVLIILYNLRCNLFHGEKGIIQIKRKYLNLQLIV